MNNLITLLIITLTLSGCSFYNRYPTTIDKAVDERSVKLVSKDGQTNVIDKVTRYTGQYYSLDKGIRTEILNPEDLDVYLLKEPSNSLQLGLLGSGCVVDGVYEKQLYLKESNFIAARFGIGYGSEFQFCLYGPCSESADGFLAMPLQSTINLIGPSRFLELGFGTTFYNNAKTSTFVAYPIVGFRYCPRERNGNCIRVFINIPINAGDKGLLLSPIGVSYGIVF